MNNTYTIKKKAIKPLLDNIDNFMTNITKFSSKYKDYSYNIKIMNNDKDPEFFDTEINITYEKQKSIKEVSRSS
jgi:hypothetical protein